MEWLTLAWKFLRGIPREVWVLLVFLAAVAFAVGYYQNAKNEAFKAGEAARQVLWDEAVARGREEIARLDRENAAHEAKARAEAVAIGENRRRDLQDAIAERDRTVAGLRAGTVRLQDKWAACVSQAEAGNTSDPAGRPDGADELRREIAGQISEADDADSKVKRLQEFVQVQQKLCEAVAGP